MPKLDSISTSFQKHATYQIMVEGKVEPLLCKLLPARLKLSYTKSEGKEISSLLGNVKDQAQLTGILNTLYNHRKTIISVIKI